MVNVSRGRLVVTRVSRGRLLLALARGVAGVVPPLAANRPLSRVIVLALVVSLEGGAVVAVVSLRVVASRPSGVVLPSSLARVGTSTSLSRPKGVVNTSAVVRGCWPAVCGSSRGPSRPRLAREACLPPVALKDGTAEGLRWARVGDG